MSDSTTLARPYAKAIFEHALAQNKLAEWSEQLYLLAYALLDKHCLLFINNPATNPEQHIELLQSLSSRIKTENKSLHHLIALLAKNKRLILLPEIKALYDVHRAEQEKTMNVDVWSVSPLSADQEQKITDSLTKRIKRKVTLKTNIDPSLLGGAIIRAGDLVIDGSVRGMLKKLSATLVV